MRVVIDHVAGSRRGQRQELAAGSRIRFGRHPDCEVAFDPHRDIDASSRHAEMRPRVMESGSAADSDWVLVDVGSSNGTYVEGHRVTETAIVQNVAVNVEFGPGGPRIRLFVGDDEAIARLPPAVVDRARPPWLVPVIGGVLALVVVGLVLTRC